MISPALTPIGIDHAFERQNAIGNDEIFNEFA
jgi:hypothetical protein